MNARRMWNDGAGGSAEYDAMLRIVTEPIPYDAIDWEVFHSRLSARAELSLARLTTLAPVPNVRSTSIRVS